MYINLTRLRDAQMAHKTLFMRVFLEDISIWISRLKRSPHQYAYVSFSPLRVWIEQKGGRRQIPSLFLNWDVYLFLLSDIRYWNLLLRGLQSLGFTLVCPLLFSDLLPWTGLSWFSSLQTADHRTSSPS